MWRWLLVLTPLLSGAAVMDLEVVGLRLLAPRFGSSTYVWGGLLGAVMAALAPGYLLGGWYADRRPNARWVYGLLCASGAYVMLVLLAGERMLDLSQKLGPEAGPVLAAALLLGPPMLLLGSISPFVVKLVADLPSLGATAGRVFALSTIGSLAGTFVSSFWLIPSYGSRATLMVTAAALLVPGLAGLLGGKRALLAPAAAALLWLVPAAPIGRGVVFAGESAYNIVYVQNEGGWTQLRLNQLDGGHSVRSASGQLMTGVYFDVLYLGPLLARGRRVLVLGMAGGTTIRGYTQIYPGVHVTAVEIDPLVVRVAREHFGIEPGPALQVHVDDARPFLAGTKGAFDVIEFDLFAGGIYPPFYCLTREAFAAAREHLLPGGVVTVNVVALGGDRSLAEAVAATMTRAGLTTFEHPLGDASVLFGFRDPTSLEEVRARLMNGLQLGPVARIVSAALGVVRPAPRGDPEVVFEDDLAPVEQITHQMLRRQQQRSQP